ncbi:MAG: single-stranded DNA-binding protein [Anaerolineales bacterium]
MYHTIIIAGNLGRDPEMRYTPSGQPVTSFSVAVNDNYTSSSGERVQRTIWFRVSVWGKQAEIANQYLKKGSKVLIEGRLVADASTGSPRLWNRQDGTVGASFEVSARTIRFLSSRAETEALESMADIGDLDSSGEDEEEIPF